MSNNTSYPKVKFPEWMYADTAVLKCSRVYEAFDTERWIKQCISDIPSAHLSLPWKEWYNKWFIQFYDSSPTTKNGGESE